MKLKKNDTIMAIILFVIIGVAFMLFGYAYQVYDNPSIGVDCHVERINVRDTYLNTYDPFNPSYSNCDNCLVLEVIGNSTESKTLFFAETHELLYDVNDTLDLKWCKHPTNDLDYIEGINKID